MNSPPTGVTLLGSPKLSRKVGELVRASVAPSTMAAVATVLSAVPRWKLAPISSGRLVRSSLATGDASADISQRHLCRLPSSHPPTPSSITSLCLTSRPQYRWPL